MDRLLNELENIFLPILYNTLSIRKITLFPLRGNHTKFLNLTKMDISFQRIFVGIVNAPKKMVTSFVLVVYGTHWTKGRKTSLNLTG